MDIFLPDAWTLYVDFMPCRYLIEIFFVCLPMLAHIVQDKWQAKCLSDTRRMLLFQRSSCILGHHHHLHNFSPRLFSSVRRQYWRTILTPLFKIRIGTIVLTICFFGMQLKGLWIIVELISLCIHSNGFPEGNTTSFTVEL